MLGGVSYDKAGKIIGNKAFTLPGSDWIRIPSTDPHQREQNQCVFGFTSGS
jgi:hypothetical protein